MRKKLLDIVRDKIRAKHYSISTEKTYLYWIKYYILFHNKTHPAQMGKQEIESFLTYLAVQKKVSASTQNQALNSILFLYKQVIGDGYEQLEYTGASCSGEKTYSTSPHKR